MSILESHQGRILQEGKEREVRITNDTYGTWFHPTNPMMVDTVLHGRTEQRLGVITQAGKEFLPKGRRDELIQMICNEDYSKDRNLLDEGGIESSIRVIYEPSTTLHKLFGRKVGRPPDLIAVRKRIKEYQNVNLLQGWEIVQVFQEIEGAFHDANFNVISPLGATDRHVFMPFIDGITLHKLIKKVPKPIRKNWVFLQEIFQETAELDTAILERMKGFLETLDFRFKLSRDLGPEYLVRHEFSHTQEVRPIDVMTDTVSFGPDARCNSADNWMIPFRQEEMSGVNLVNEILHMAKNNQLENAARLIRSTMCMVDPIFISQLKKDTVFI